MPQDVVIHVAAAPTAAGQKCSRCGIVLIDWTNQKVLMSTGSATLSLGWKPGSYVAVVAGGSFMMNRDAQGRDEIACNARVQ